MSPALKALVPAGSAGILFILLWLVLGIPLPFALAAAPVGYLALWAMLKGLGPKEGEEVLFDQADLGLARKTAARGRALAKSVRAELSGFEASGSFGRKFSRLADLIEAIAKDVEADPKDALAAAAFLDLHASAVPRLAGMVRRIEEGIQPETRRREAATKIALALDRLILAHERQLSRLQDDNLAELQAEIEVLEEGLGLDNELGPGKEDGGSSATAAR